MIWSWDQIAARPGFSAIQRLIDQRVIPQFERLPQDVLSKDGAPKNLQGMMLTGGLLFCGLFLATFLILPGGWVGEVLRFVLFFPLAILSFGIVFWFHKNRISHWLLRAQVRYSARAKAWNEIAHEIDLAYVPRPGGEHVALEWLTKQSWLPADLRSALNGMPETDLSMAPAVEAARTARIMGREPIVIGSAEQKAMVERQALQVLNVEDGFHGVRSGIAFDAFEWIDSSDEGSNTHHLILVLKLPKPVRAITELRSRKLSWLAFRDQAKMDAVDLGLRAFRDQYRLRSSDQVEARFLFDPAVIERLLTIAHDGPFRAVARDEYLVVDLEGDNRFEILDLHTGAWSDEAFRRGLTDLIETLDLVDAFAAIFRLQ